MKQLRNFLLIPLLALLPLGPCYAQETPSEEWSISLSHAPEWVSLERIGIAASLLEVDALGLDGTVYTASLRDVPKLSELESLHVSGGSVMINCYWADESVTQARVDCLDLDWQQQDGESILTLQTQGLSKLATAKSVKRGLRSFAGNLFKALFLSNEGGVFMLDLHHSPASIHGSMQVGTAQITLGEDYSESGRQGGWELEADTAAFARPLLHLTEALPDVIERLREEDLDNTSAAALEWALPMCKVLARCAETVESVKTRVFGSYEMSEELNSGQTCVQLLGAQRAVIIGMGLEGLDSPEERHLALRIHNEKEAVDTLSRWFSEEAPQLLAQMLGMPSVEHYARLGGVLPKALAYMLRSLGEPQENGDLRITLGCSKEGSLVLGGVDIYALGDALLKRLPGLPNWRPW